MPLEKVPKISGGSPVGGSTGQTLVKASGTDFDYTWATIGEGFDVKASVKVMTPVGVNINLGVGGLLTVDTYTVADGDRVLVAAQAAPAENGIYIAHAGAWLRAPDADTGDKLNFGAFVFVENGSALYISTGWVMTTAGTITIGVSSIVWTQFSQAGIILAGTGLTKAGNTISAVGNLLAVANAVSAADTLFYFTGAGTGTVATLTAFGRSLLDDVDGAASRTTTGSAALNGLSTENFSALVLKSYANLVVPKTSGKGIQVDTTSPTFGWKDLLGEWLGGKYSKAL